MKTSKLMVSKSLQSASSVKLDSIPGDSELMTRSELIRKLKTSAPTLYRLEKKGLIPSTPCGGQKRYEWNKVLESLNNQGK